MSPRTIVIAALFVALGARGADVDPLPVGFVTFTGLITAQAVADFIASHSDASVRRVIVDSPGGDVVAGLSLANWMVDREVDVEVRNLCASSCANYLFAAGQRKIIDDRALVIWHGSMLQKDFRALCAPREPRAQPEYGPPGYVEGLGRSQREAMARFCTVYRTVIADQDSFFTRVHVDEYLTRMGQEPTNFEAVWTVPTSVMERMGLTGVEARADYGTQADIAHFNTGPNDTEPIISLSFDPAGRVVPTTR